MSGNLISTNNKLILEPYKGSTGLKTEQRGGLAMISQKINLVGLKVLASGNIGDRFVPAGTIAYFREEKMKATWATQVFSSDSIEGDFMIAPSGEVEFIKQIEKGQTT